MCEGLIICENYRGVIFIFVSLHVSQLATLKKSENIKDVGGSLFVNLRQIYVLIYMPIKVFLPWHVGLPQVHKCPTSCNLKKLGI